MGTITYLDLIRVWCSRCNRSQLLRRSEGQEVVSCPWRCHACGHDNLDPVSGSMKEDQRIVEELHDFAAKENAVVYGLEEYVLRYWHTLKEEE